MTIIDVLMACSEVNAENVVLQRVARHVSIVGPLVTELERTLRPVGQEATFHTPYGQAGYACLRCWTTSKRNT